MRLQRPNCILFATVRITVVVHHEATHAGYVRYVRELSKNVWKVYPTFTDVLLYLEHNTSELQCRLVSRRAVVIQFIRAVNFDPVQEVSRRSRAR